MCLIMQHLPHIPAGRGAVDEFIQGDPAIQTGPPQPHHLPPVPTLRLSKGRLPGERCTVLAGGPEVQGEEMRMTGRNRHD